MHRKVNRAFTFIPLRWAYFFAENGSQRPDLRVSVEDVHLCRCPTLGQVQHPLLSPSCLQLFPCIIPPELLIFESCEFSVVDFRTGCFTWIFSKRILEPEPQSVVSLLNSRKITWKMFRQRSPHQKSSLRISSCVYLQVKSTLPQEIHIPVEDSQ